jgi:SAM-dependent methyltransferase
MSADSSTADSSGTPTPGSADSVVGAEPLQTSIDAVNPVTSIPSADVGSQVSASVESRSGERSRLAASTSSVEAPRGYDAKTAGDYESERGHGFTLPGERAAWTSDIGAILQRVSDKLPSDPRVLDIGCGTGKFTRLTADVLSDHGRLPTVVGVDASPDMLNIAKTLDNDRIGYVLGDARDLEVDGPYDLITSCQVLDSFENPHEVLANWQNMLKPGGHLLTVLAFSRPDGWTNRTADELDRMPLARVTSIEPLVQAVMRAGYENVDAGFLPTVSPLHGGAAEGGIGPVGSRYYAIASAPLR